MPIEIGSKIISQAKIILQGSNRMKEIVHEEEGELSGELKIGIIPTLAPLFTAFVYELATKKQDSLF